MLTNEEKRAQIDTTSAQPTIPGSVNQDTPLEALNFNWRERDLPERERTKHVHRLHPYLGKFIPQLVEIFLRKFFEPGQTVLDPFCGSGTTLVQANELGINAVGFDISAFNVLLSRVKVADYDLPRARHEIHDILRRTQIATQLRHQPTLWDDSTTEVAVEDNDPYLREWFAPQALNELLTYRHFIDAGGYEYGDLLRVILSRSARSARLTTHFDLDFPKRPQTEPYWCYKHSRECEPTTEAFKFLKRYSLDTLRRIEAFSHRRTPARVIVRQADSRTAEVPPIHGVITSPPYLGLIDYHEQHAYAYHLLRLEDRREAEIGPAANGTSQAAREQYLTDIAQVFRHAAAAMPEGGRIIVVAHDRSNLYSEIVKLAGLETEAVLNRHVNRRTGRRASEFYESVFIWRRP